MTKRHEMYAYVEVEVYFAVMGKIGEISIYQFEGGVESDV